jgi:polysaccharide biosynthesis protein PslH
MGSEATMTEPATHPGMPPGDGEQRAAILMLTYISPLQRWGSAKRSRFLVDALKRHGTVDVLVLSLVDATSVGEALTTTEWNGVKVMELKIAQRGVLGRPRFDLTSTYVTREVARHVDLSGYDLLVSRYVKPALKLALPQGVPVLVDFDDAVYEPPWRALRSVKSWVGVALRLFNDRVILRSRLSCPDWRRAHFLFCRDAERKVFGWLPASVLPNLPPAADRGGPPDFAAPTQPALMFVGLLDYMPNHDAVDWFLDAIWPEVLQSVPDARFLIVGSGSDDRLRRWRQHPRVETLGFVESLADAYATATACVVPMRSGAGTNIKALEPYLYGRMVIATPLVVAGHEPLFTAGDDILEAADARGLASHCIDMLRNPRRASEMAQRGYRRITSTLTEERFRAIVDSAVGEVLRPGPQLTPTG